jgi:hypothetical protein
MSLSATAEYSATIGDAFGLLSEAGGTAQDAKIVK